MNEIQKPIVGLIMGSISDWETMKHAETTLKNFNLNYECKIISAHRTPELMRDYAKSADKRGLEVIIAAAGGAAHLPGMVASYTSIPVLGVPIQSHSLNGIDSLLSIVQMPRGVPVGTLAIGMSGAINGALLAISIVSNSRPSLRKKLNEYRVNQTTSVLDSKLPSNDIN